MAWPAVPRSRAGRLRALCRQLQATQWWQPARLRALQMRQIELLVAHAAKTVPYYRGRFAAIAGLGRGAMTPDHVGRLPLLRRGDIQDAGAALASLRPPPAHGRTGLARTSGATGRPVVVGGSEITLLFFAALTLRFHAWHRRDLSATAAAIRVLRGKDAERAKAGQGIPWAPGHATTPMRLFDISHPIGEQLAWLVEQDPHYLVTYPTNLEALLECGARDGVRLPRLREVSTMAEVLDPALRAACQAVWGVPIADLYSATEVGMIALQCPDRPHYHVQEESLFVEVLDDDGRPSAPGEVGRVVVTDLHNFATPLIRYEIGDHAEVGEPCSCGRGLGVLTRVLGRSRNMCVLPNGERIWPTFGSRGITAVAPVRQHQFVQKSLERIEAHLVTARPLAGEEEEALRRHILKTLGHRFEIAFVYRDDIPRGASGKYEDFLSEVAG